MTLANDCPRRRGRRHAILLPCQRHGSTLGGATCEKKKKKRHFRLARDVNVGSISYNFHRTFVRFFDPNLEVHLFSTTGRPLDFLGFRWWSWLSAAEREKTIRLWCYDVELKTMNFGSTFFDSFLIFLIFSETCLKFFQNFKLKQVVVDWSSGSTLKQATGLRAFR